MPSRRIETWDIHRLKKNPHQDALVRPLSPPEFEELASDVEEKGRFDHPIEVLPDGMILDGRHRYLVALRLGWDEVRVRVRVRVRYDLEGDPLAAERRVLETNSLRKQLDALDRARLSLRAVEIEERVGPGGLDGIDLSLLDRQLAETLGLSKKHAKRLRAIVAGTPMPVQVAVSERKLSIVDAAKVARLSAGAKREIVEQIEAGVAPAEAVTRHVVRARRATPDPGKRVRAFLNLADRRLNEFEGHESEVFFDGEEAAMNLRTIDGLAGFCEKLWPILRRQKSRAEKAARETKKLIAELKSKRRHRRRP
jgi:ParB-like chromosome segregation protein Spo0J